MSKEMMVSMMEKASSDQGFAGGLVAAVGEREGQDAVSAIAEYGKANGFSVTEADVAEMRSQLIAATAPSDGDLADDDLENVAGGVEGVRGLPGYVMDSLVGNVFPGILQPLPGNTPVFPPSATPVPSVGDFFKQW